MTMSRDLQRGWTASILVHLALLTILMLVQVPTMSRKTEFVEVSWGAQRSIGFTKPAPEPEQKQAAEDKPTKPTRPARIKKLSSQPVVLPERKLASFSEESLPVPYLKKLETSEQPSIGGKIESGVKDNREQRIAVSGQSAKDTSGGGIGTGTGGVQPEESETGSGVSRSVGFSIQWSDGGTRRKLSGSLPRYPEGVNVEVQIKVRTVVAADGSVKTVQPAQKANAQLENAAMKEIRFWKFDALKPDQPQIDQTCVVTFLFKLK